MTSLVSTFDLVEQAERRARLASLLGRLLVSEPGPDLAPLVAGVESFAVLGSDDAALAAAYERLFLRDVPLYESVFLGEDGQRGGPRPAAVADAYDAAGFDEVTRWRIAGPDHLGLELRCYGHLCAQEAAAWRDEVPDLATRAVDAERALLSEHAGQWGEVAMEAVARRAAGSPYGDVATAVSAFLAAESERLRPAPDHPGLGGVVVAPPPTRLGPARLSRWLLSPGSSGAFLDANDLGAAALALGIPWRPSDPRSRFRQVVEDAVDGGDLAALLYALRAPVERWHAFHAEREATRDGDRRVWRTWRLRAAATLELLDRSARPQAPRASSAGPVTVTVVGPDDATRDALLVDVVSRLRELDGVVTVSLELEPRLAAVLRAAARAGADEVLLDGTGVAAIVTRGDVHRSRTDIVVRLDAGASAAGRVDVDAGGPLADAVRRAVADLVAGEGHR